MQKFSELALSEVLQRNLATANHENQTEIQLLALPPALSGKDLIACAQTGGGKTAVYALGILHRIERAEHTKPRALILVPTRELALQVESQFALYGKGTGLRGAVIYGGAPMGHQIMRLRRGTDIIIATPGRLFDHMTQGNVDLSKVEMLVLDEADRLLDMGFAPQVKQIVDKIPRDNRQTMLFSATMDAAVEALAKAYLFEPEIVNAQPRSTTVEQIEQIVHRVQPREKGTMLMSLLYDARESGGTSLVFTRTRLGADRLEQEIKEAGMRSGCIHGDISQNQRERVLNHFRAGRLEVLVATDVAARGIDVPHITHVINYDVPMCAEDYVHRIGRTGRAGRTGTAYTLVTQGDTPYLRAIEKLVGKRLDPNPPSYEELNPRKRFGGAPGRPYSQKRGQTFQPREAGRNYGNRGSYDKPVRHAR